jgi:hypothetical protein
MKSSLLAFFLIISSSVFSQEIIIGPQLYMNSTTFKVDGTTLSNPGFATAHSTLTGGLGYRLSNKVFAQHNFMYFKQVHDANQFEEFSYLYSYVGMHNNILFSPANKWYFGAGVPISYTLNARQSNGFGSLDLLAEGNTPEFNAGYNAILGYKQQISDTFTIYFDCTRTHFLQSLDNDPGQKLIAKSYAISFKAAFRL